MNRFEIHFSTIISYISMFTNFKLLWKNCEITDTMFLIISFCHSYLFLQNKLIFILLKTLMYFHIPFLIFICLAQFIYCDFFLYSLFPKCNEHKILKHTLTNTRQGSEIKKIELKNSFVYVLLYGEYKIYV